MKIALVGFGKINQIISNKDSVDVMGVIDSKKKTIKEHLFYNPKQKYKRKKMV